jgi:hypothetical protein
MSKKFIVGMFVVLVFLNVSFPSHAEIYQSIILQTESSDFVNFFWAWDYNGDDVNVQTGSIWQGSLWIDVNGSTFDVTWGFSKYGQNLFVSDPVTLTFEAGGWWEQSGQIDIDGYIYEHEISIDQHVGSAHADLLIANTGVVVPEPISSTLFIIGGATLGFRRFRKKFKK